MQPDNRTWDPGRVQDHDERNKLCKINVPDYLYSLMSTMMVSAIDVSEEVNATEEEESRTELDSHAVKLFNLATLLVATCDHTAFNGSVSLLL